jgi:hypothetical protein
LTTSFRRSAAVPICRITCSGRVQRKRKPRIEWYSLDARRRLTGSPGTARLSDNSKARSPSSI